MRWTGVLILFAVVLAAGWSLPDSDLAGPQGRAVGVQTAPKEPASVEEDSHDRGSPSMLARQGDGHFYANVEVDDAEIRFLVDTGASTIALTAADAEAIGLSWSEEELRRVGRGVGGEVLGKPVVLQSVQLGELSADNVSAVIIPKGLHVSLLGQSFLAKASRVQIENDVMIIS
ncbi:MAG: TIGR02281 family clan AA aspartic protease [Sphingomonadaceae bacterium]|nr:TIGR02281 family clan AA aspartic protease [Sphingomonadaceae bacterium]